MGLLLDLSRLRAGVERVSRRIEPSEFGPPSDDLRIAAPVDLDVTARKDASKVRVQGRVRTTLECLCSRCLEPFAVPVDAEIDAVFLPVSANTGEAEEEIAGDDLGVSFYKDDVIDLGEMVREQCYLALPMKPLCRDDCRGLCPVCGVNRNHEACTCRVEWIDPRLEALRRFTTDE